MLWPLNDPLSPFFVPHLWLPEHLKEGIVPKFPQLFKYLWLHLYFRKTFSAQVALNCVCLVNSAVEIQN